MRNGPTYILCQENFTDEADNCPNNANPGGVSVFVPDAGGYLCPAHIEAWRHRYCGYGHSEECDERELYANA